MAMTSLCTVAGVGALLAYLYSMDANVSFNVVDIKFFGLSARHFEEAQLLFNIDADLTSLMHVNTRLYYAYIQADWKSGKNDQHSDILWNELIKKESPVFKGELIPGNFTLRSMGASLMGKSVNLSFKIQQVPYVGFFRTKTLLTKEFKLPNKYIQ